MAQASNRKRSFQKMKMAGENKTEALKAVNVEIEKLRNKLEDKLEEVKDLQEKVKELVAIVKESEIKVLGEDKHEQKDTSKKHSKVNDKENDVMTETKELQEYVKYILTNSVSLKCILRGVMKNTKSLFEKNARRNLLQNGD